jgi:hypothetical protein
LQPESTMARRCIDCVQCLAECWSDRQYSQTLHWKQNHPDRAGRSNNPQMSQYHQGKPDT